MDILIKGMEMPSDEKHSVVLVFGKDGFEEARDSYSALKIEGITAVALPEHGDLVDRNQLKAVSYEIMRFPDEEANKMFLELIDNAPTIVEAAE